jgi:ATP-dependent Zn protease
MSLSAIYLIGTIATIPYLIHTQPIAPNTVLPTVSSSRETWRYSQFIQEVEQRKIQKVGITADRTRALVEAKDGRRAWVNLPTDPELIEILTRNDVDIYVLPR